MKFKIFFNDKEKIIENVLKDLQCLVKRRHVLKAIDFVAVMCVVLCIITYENNG